MGSWAFVSEAQPGRTFPRSAALVFSALCFATGAAVFALGAGWLDADPRGQQAPPWVIMTAGIMFFAGGFVPLGLAFSFGERLNELTGFIVGSAFAAILNWIAFGSGERTFTFWLSAGGKPLSGGSGNEVIGRVCFGVGAALINVMLLAKLWRWLRRPQRRDTNSLPRM
jgi:hypothetical protein